MSSEHLVLSTVRRPIVLAGAAAIVALGAAGCGSSGSSSSVTAKAAAPAGTSTVAKTPEVSPSGDISDKQAYVPIQVPGAKAKLTVPEGWSRTSTGGAVRFTDKLNAIKVETMPAGAPPTARDAKQTEVPKLAAAVPGFKLQGVSTVTRKAGTAIRTLYLADAKADPVTGKAGIDAVERYVFFKNGKDLVLTLSGPKGADNVDPWKIVTNSVSFTA
jgi:hypothetical protein